MGNSEKSTDFADEVKDLFDILKEGTSYILHIYLSFLSKVIPLDFIEKLFDDHKDKSSYNFSKNGKTFIYRLLHSIFEIEKKLVAMGLQYLYSSVPLPFLKSLYENFCINNNLECTDVKLRKCKKALQGSKNSTPQKPPGNIGTSINANNSVSKPFSLSASKQPNNNSMMNISVRNAVSDSDLSIHTSHISESNLSPSIITSSDNTASASTMVPASLTPFTVSSPATPLTANSSISFNALSGSLSVPISSQPSSSAAEQFPLTYTSWTKAYFPTKPELSSMTSDDSKITNSTLNQVISSSNLPNIKDFARPVKSEFNILSTPTSIPISSNDNQSSSTSLSNSAKNDSDQQSDSTVKAVSSPGDVPLLGNIVKADQQIPAISFDTNIPQAQKKIDSSVSSSNVINKAATIVKIDESNNNSKTVSTGINLPVFDPPTDLSKLAVTAPASLPSDTLSNPKIDESNKQPTTVSTGIYFPLFDLKKIDSSVSTSNVINKTDNMAKMDESNNDPTTVSKGISLPVLDLPTDSFKLAVAAPASLPSKTMSIPKIDESNKNPTTLSTGISLPAFDFPADPFKLAVAAPASILSNPQPSSTPSSVTTSKISLPSFETIPNPFILPASTTTQQSNLALPSLNIPVFTPLPNLFPTSVPNAVNSSSETGITPISFKPLPDLFSTFPTSDSVSSTYAGNSPFRIENLESYNRIVNLPIVNSGLNIAEHIYERIKKTNTMISWTLDQAEDTIKSVTHNPAIGLLETPLTTIDRVICKSLDVVESKIPSINLPPKMIYSNTLDYISDVSTKIVKPVLKRADSVKQIGNTVLTSKYTEYAADKLDDALDVADAYIDKYLPDQDDQKDYQNENIIPDTPGRKAMHTIQHVDRVSKKLQRRLTRRTLEHAKIIKEQSTEAIHVLLYVAELVVTDPKLACQKGKELWSELSRDEPENQARPKNVEELFVLLVRESSRQVVHLVNFSSRQIIRLPQIVARATHQVEAVIESFHLDEVKTFLNDAMKRQVQIVNFILQEVESFTSKVLEQARQPESEQSPPSTIVLTVPKLKVNAKAASTKAHVKVKHSHEHSDHHSSHRSPVEHRSNPKINGSHATQKTEDSNSF